MEHVGKGRNSFLLENEDYHSCCAWSLGKWNEMVKRTFHSCLHKNSSDSMQETCTKRHMCAFMNYSSITNTNT